MKTVVRINIKPTPMVLERSYGRQSVGTHESTMELFLTDDHCSGMIEWDVPGLGLTEHIGLQFDCNRNLLDYDGVFSLPKEAIDFLRSQAFIISEEFE